jgi:hypothetical protein
MTPRIVRALGALLVLGSATAAAQQPPAAPGSLDSVIRILRLPRTTTEAREKGVPDSQVGGIIDILRRSRVPAGDAQVILQGEVDAKAAGQPNDNFGAFVQAQHRAGLRGRALADAIHAEQARRGMGRGQGQKKPDTDAREGGGAARGGQGGRPDAAQPATPRTRGRSDTAHTSPGRSSGQGRKP